MHNPDTVTKPGMLCTMIYQVGITQLPDIPQTLKGLRLDDSYFPFIYRNQTMHRISEIAGYYNPLPQTRYALQVQILSTPFTFVYNSCQQFFDSRLRSIASANPPLSIVLCEYLFYCHCTLSFVGRQQKYGTNVCLWVEAVGWDLF